jgi:CelD/BcsL family acetyltransferase involved in cellulose biosynthesis
MDQLQSIEDNIWSIWQTSESTPFQTPAWLIPWWKYFGNGKLTIPVLCQGKKLKGMLPFYIRNGRNAGKITATILGMGNSDYLDGLVENRSEEITDYLFETFMNARSEWDLLDIDDLPQSTPLIRSIRKQGGVLKQSSEGMMINLPRNPDEFLARLQSQHRYKIRKAVRSLTNLGDLELEYAEQSQLPEFLNDLVRLHSATWKMRNQNGVLSGNRIVCFHKEVISRSQEKGLLGLFRLKCGEKTISIVYGFIKKPTFYSYLGGFDPEFARYSPGGVILLYVIFELIRKGFREFDFLKGSEPYKRMWGAEPYIRYRISMRRR